MFTVKSIELCTHADYVSRLAATTTILLSIATPRSLNEKLSPIIMSKILAQLILAGSQVLGRALTRAIRQELESARQAASKRPQNVPPPIQTDMTLDEAMRILNVEKLDTEVIDKNYKHLFEANDRKNGGSLYLQSKVYRAKERIDQELGRSTT